MDEKHRSGRLRVGLISDTHGRLDPRVAKALDGVDHIVHAGDIGSAAVLWELEVIAPVTAVAGNVDRHDRLGEDLPCLAQLRIGDTSIAVVHERAELPHAASSSDVVVFGHSHRPLVERLDDTLWVNPGSASQARTSPIGRSVALLELDGGDLPEARIVPLSDYGERA